MLRTHTTGDEDRANRSNIPISKAVTKVASRLIAQHFEQTLNIATEGAYKTDHHSNQVLNRNLCGNIEIILTGVPDWY